MTRCALAVLVMAVMTLPAAAQLQRNFPANALRGDLQLEQPPEARLDGRPVRLAPGARIRGENNLLVVSGALARSRHTVHYTLDLHGQLLEIWVLTAAERANTPWPRTAAEAARWTFDPIAQRWSK